MRTYIEGRRTPTANSAALREDNIREPGKRRGKHLESPSKRTALPTTGFDDRRFRAEVNTDRNAEPAVSRLTMCGDRKYSDWVGLWGELNVLPSNLYSAR